MNVTPITRLLSIDNTLTINNMQEVNRLYNKYNLTPSEKIRLIQEYVNAHVNISYVKWLAQRLAN